VTQNELHNNQGYHHKRAYRGDIGTIETKFIAWRLFSLAAAYIGFSDALALHRYQRCRERCRFGKQYILVSHPLPGFFHQLTRFAKERGCVLSEHGTFNDSDGRMLFDHDHTIEAPWH